MAGRGGAGAAARGVAATGRPERVCDAVRHTGWSLHRHERNLDRSSNIGEAEGSSGKNNTEVASAFASCFRRVVERGAAVTAEPAVRAPRGVRKDAARNREALLAAASEVYAERGVEASLEEIARRAGVGIGTLYRHFPNRDALNEAVYRREVDSLCDGVDALLAEQAPVEALAQWMRRFAGYVARKRGMAMALKSALGPDNELFSHSHRRITQALSTLVDAAVASRRDPFRRRPRGPAARDERHLHGHRLDRVRRADRPHRRPAGRRAALRRARPQPDGVLNRSTDGGTAMPARRSGAGNGAA